MSVNEEAIEKEIQAKGLNAPRLSPEHITDQIVGIHYINPDESVMLSCLTICILELKNGFTVVGTSACVSPENFDVEIGKKIAFENACQQIWSLEDYHLRHKLVGQILK